MAPKINVILSGNGQDSSGKRSLKSLVIGLTVLLALALVLKAFGLKTERTIRLVRPQNPDTKDTHHNQVSHSETTEDSASIKLQELANEMIKAEARAEGIKFPIERRRILLASTWRSGSSYLGELIGRQGLQELTSILSQSSFYRFPGVFYTFEPFIATEPSAYAKTAANALLTDQLITCSYKLKKRIAKALALSRNVRLKRHWKGKSINPK